MRLTPALYQPVIFKSLCIFLISLWCFRTAGVVSKLGEEPVLFAELVDEFYGILTPIEVIFFIFEICLEKVVCGGVVMNSGYAVAEHFEAFGLTLQVAFHVFHRVCNQDSLRDNKFSGDFTEAFLFWGTEAGMPPLLLVLSLLLGTEAGMPPPLLGHSDILNGTQCEAGMPPLLISRVESVFE